MMTDKEILSIVEPMFNKCVSNEHDIKKVRTFDDDLYGDLEFTSLTMVETIMLIENHFKIKINDEDIQRVKTVQDLINLVKKYINDNGE